MKVDADSLTDSQKEVIAELDKSMKHLFGVFVRIDEEDIPLSDSLELIGMEIPLLVRPAINQLSGKLKAMRKEEQKAALKPA